MRILLTGADGFTGRHFVPIAQAKGHKVIPLQADLNDCDAIHVEVAQASPEAVVHLAAISFVGHADVSAFYDVNVIGTLNLLDALAATKHPPQKILLASSANVYGNCEQSPIKETQEPAPINHYAMSKLSMEFMALAYHAQLPLFFVRPFNYTGPGQASSFLIPKLVSHFARRAEFVELGNLDVEREFNDVRFVCDTYLELLKKAKTKEIYNVCSGKPVTLKSVIAILSKISGHELVVKTNPAFVRNNEIHRLCGSPAKLIKAVGEMPMPLIEDTLRWMFELYSADNL